MILITNLYEIFKKAQNNSEKHVIEIYNRFLPLIKKYSRKLNYEEAETDLTIYLLEYIKKVNLNKFKNKNDGEIVNYMRLVFKNKYIDIIRQFKNKNIKKMILQKEIAYNDCYKKLDEDYTYDLIKTLNDIQKKIIIARYLNDYSDLELSKTLNISRQSVYKNRKKALELIKIEINN